jgi:hypothetical protein
MILLVFAITNVGVFMALGDVEPDATGLTAAVFGTMIAVLGCNGCRTRSTAPSER